MTAASAVEMAGPATAGLAAGASVALVAALHRSRRRAARAVVRDHDGLPTRSVAHRRLPTGTIAGRASARGAAVAALLVAVAAASLGPVGAALAVVGAMVAPVWRRRRHRRRRELAVRRSLPEAVELLVLLVRAGRVPAAAVVAAAPHLAPPLATAFEAVERRLRSGARFADAIQALPHELGAVAQPVADALATADRYGLPLAPMLESLAHEARHARRRNDEAEARQLPVRLAVPLVVCNLSSFVLVAIVPVLLGALSSLDVAG